MILRGGGTIKFNETPIADMVHRINGVPCVHCSCPSVCRTNIEIPVFT